MNEIETFKTHCRLPDNSIGEVCKRYDDSNNKIKFIFVDEKDKQKELWLVCSSRSWWTVSTDYILQNKANV